MDSKEQAILKTLLYGDIFNYPLTKEELFKYLISNQKIDKKLLLKALNTKIKSVGKKNNYFFLKGKEELVSLRTVRGKIAKEKYIKAIKLIKIIGLIPFVKFIGISGALSMRNSEQSDDIDFFVITERELTWSARLFLVMLLRVMGVYRKRGDTNVANKICLNMIIDEKNMGFIKKDRNLYIAHEIAQLVPILDKNNTYRNFLQVNSWIKKFLPNSIYFRKKPLINNNDSLRFVFVVIARLMFLENISKFLQQYYMKNNITKEIIKDGFLSFHPFDYKVHALGLYAKKIKQFGIKNLHD